MTTTERLYTIKEVLAMPDDGKRYELWEGHLEEMSPTSGEHAEIGAALIEYLRAYVRKNKLGRVFMADAAFTINAATNTYFAPDAAFVAAGRVSGMLKGEVLVAPDLVVEILSKHDYAQAHPTKFRKKIIAYQAANVQLVWVIDPNSKSVLVYRLGSDTPTPRLFDEELSGEDVIKGFTIKVGELFETDDI